MKKRAYNSSRLVRPDQEAGSSPSNGRPPKYLHDVFIINTRRGREREWKVHTSRADWIEIPNLQEALQMYDYRTGIYHHQLKSARKRKKGNSHKS